MAGHAAEMDEKQYQLHMHAINTSVVNLVEPVTCEPNGWIVDDY
jgi:hypothetical protein